MSSDTRARSIARAVLDTTPADWPAWEDLWPAQRAPYEQRGQRDGIPAEQAYREAVAEARVAQAEDRQYAAVSAALAAALGRR